MASEQWKQYWQAGMEATEVTRKRAEKLVRDLVKNGEVQAQEAGARVDELLEHSRRSTEQFGERVRAEVQRQMQALGLVQPVKQTAKKASATAKKTATKAAGSAKTTATKAAGSAKTTATKAAGSAKKAATKSAGSAKKTATKAASTAKKAAGRS